MEEVLGRVSSTQQLAFSLTISLLALWCRKLRARNVNASWIAPAGIMKPDKWQVFVTIEQQVIEKMRDLPPEKQQEVLDFVDFLKEKNGIRKPRRSLLGLWSDLNVHITEEDIAEARREMWGNFPRDIKL